MRWCGSPVVDGQKAPAAGPNEQDASQLVCSGTGPHVRGAMTHKRVVRLQGWHARGTAGAGEERGRERAERPGRQCAPPTIWDVSPAA